MKRKLALLGCTLLTLSLSPFAFAQTTLGTSFSFNGFVNATSAAIAEDYPDPLPSVSVITTGYGNIGEGSTPGSYFYENNGSGSYLELNSGSSTSQNLGQGNPVPLNYLQYNLTRAGGDTDSYVDTVTMSGEEINVSPTTVDLTFSILYSENNGATWLTAATQTVSYGFPEDTAKISGTINVPSSVNSLEVEYAISNDGNFRTDDANIYQYGSSFVGTPGPAVPEPSTWALMLCGLVLVARFARKGLKNGLSS